VTSAAAWDVLVPVHLLKLPVPLAATAREHFEGLVREFFLIAAGAGHDDHVPIRLMHLVDTITAQFGGLTTAADRRLDDAIDAHVEVIEDHVLEVPPAAGPAAQALGDMIDEADEYCRRGEHLLTLATPADCLAYRRWYLAQVIGQLQGEPPVAWPDSEPARGL